MEPPHLGHRPAGRNGELRQRDPVLLRLDRADRGRAASGRRGPRPLRGDCYAATADGPATLERRAGPTPARRTQLGDFVVSLAIIGRGGIARERRVAHEIRISRRMGSAALALAYVASGRFDANVQNGGLSLWDIAAAGLIAERAGAKVTDLYGGPWWNVSKRPARLSIVAAPEPHHAKLHRVAARGAHDGRRPGASRNRPHAGPMRTWPASARWRPRCDDPGGDRRRRAAASPAPRSAPR